MTLEKDIKEYRKNTLSLLEKIKEFEKQCYIFMRNIESLNTKIHLLQIKEAQNAIERI